MLAWIYLGAVATIAGTLMLLLGAGEYVGRSLALAVGAILVVCAILAIGQLVQVRSRRHYSRDLVAHRYRR